MELENLPNPLPLESLEPEEVRSSMTELLIAALIGHRKLSIDQAFACIKATGRKVARETVHLALLDIEERLKSWEGFPFDLMQYENEFELIPKTESVAKAAGIDHIEIPLSPIEKAVLAIAIYCRPKGGVSWNAIVSRFRGPLDDIAHSTQSSLNSTNEDGRIALDSLEKKKLLYSREKGRSILYNPTSRVLRQYGISKWEDFPNYSEFSAYFEMHGDNLSIKEGLEEKLGLALQATIFHPAPIS